MILLNNRTLTVHYDGVIYSKEVEDHEVPMIKIYAMDIDYESIIDLCFPTPVKLLKREGFWEQDGSLYYKNIKVSIPQVLANKFLNADEDEFNRLIKFWGWLSLNPNPRTRENLYEWVEKNGIQLTNGGLMILYRRVVKAYFLYSQLGRFAENEYLRLRKNKKSTNVDVYLDSETSTYYTSKVNYGDKCVGNLKDLYEKCNSSEFYYTDKHTRLERYVIGEESRMPRTKGDESDASCSRGYHLAGPRYNFSGFGDTPIVAIVNPMDIFNAVDDATKIRTAAFTPIAVLTSDCEWIDDPQVHQRIDDCYDEQVERLQKLLNEGNFEDYTKHEVLSNPWNLAVNFETVLKILN